MFWEAHAYSPPTPLSQHSLSELLTFSVIKVEAAPVSCQKGLLFLFPLLPSFNLLPGELSNIWELQLWTLKWNYSFNINLESPFTVGKMTLAQIPTSHCLLHGTCWMGRGPWQETCTVCCCVPSSPSLSRPFSFSEFYVRDIEHSPKLLWVCVHCHRIVVFFN